MEGKESLDRQDMNKLSELGKGSGVQGMERSGSYYRSIKAKGGIAMARGRPKG